MKRIILALALGIGLLVAAVTAESHPDAPVIEQVSNVLNVDEAETVDASGFNAGASRIVIWFHSSGAKGCKLNVSGNRQITIPWDSFECRIARYYAPGSIYEVTHILFYGWANICHAHIAVLSGGVWVNRTYSTYC